MRTVLKTLLVLIVVATIQKQASAQDNSDFLSGIFGQQVESNQGETNGGQSNNNTNSDELRLGIYDEESDDSGDSADAGGGGAGAGGGAGGGGAGGGASET